MAGCFSGGMSRTIFQLRSSGKDPLVEAKVAVAKLLGPAAAHGDLQFLLPTRLHSLPARTIQRRAGRPPSNGVNKLLGWAVCLGEPSVKRR